MLSWLKVIIAALRHKAEFAAILAALKAIAGDKDIQSAIKEGLGGLAEIAEKLPAPKKPSEWTADERKQWEDRGLSSGH